MPDSSDTAIALYPLRFEPIFQYRLWGGRHLGDWMTDVTLPDGPVGEAWILSDRKDHASPVAEGPLKGVTITTLMATRKRDILGDLADRFDRFPLLLKFLDVAKMLSVQVHPRDDQHDLIPEGDSGKTEAWLVLQAQAKGRIYAGLKPGTTAQDLRDLTTGSADDHLASFKPQVGQGVLIEAGTVHSLGDGVVVFEVQENSDTTFRLYDWDHVDEKTGRKRDLQVDQALQCIDLDQGLACIDVDQGPTTPVTPKAGAADGREAYFDDPHFRLERIAGHEPFAVGAEREPRILVCVEGSGAVEHEGAAPATLRRGEVILLPAALCPCRFRPQGHAVVLEIAA